LLRENGRLSSDDTDRIYDGHLSPLRLGDRVEHIGGELSAELRAVVAALDSARGDAAAYGQTLRGATNDLTRPTTDRDTIRGIVEGLITETRRMEERNSDLEKRLIDSKRQIDDLQISLEAIRNESLTDPLTNLANRKCFDQSLTRTIADAENTGKAFSLLFTDIDHFKKFNDSYGHQTGDQVLRLVAVAVKQNVKGQDIAARYGGEEFAVILPRTGLEQAMKVAEHIREAVMSKELVKRSTGERLGRITISIGCAMWSPDDTASTLIERADAALYRAKNLGRNRVCSESDVGPRSAVA
jgi:diguanylate cyclase